MVSPGNIFYPSVNIFFTAFQPGQWSSWKSLGQSVLSKHASGLCNLDYNTQWTLCAMKKKSSFTYIFSESKTELLASCQKVIGIANQIKSEYTAKSYKARSMFMNHGVSGFSDRTATYPNCTPKMFSQSICDGFNLGGGWNCEILNMLRSMHTSLPGFCAHMLCVWGEVWF